MTKKIFTLLTALVLSIGIGWAKMAPDSTGVSKHEHVKVERRQVEKSIANAPRRAIQAVCDHPDWYWDAYYADGNGSNTFNRSDVNFTQVSSSQICLCAEWDGSEFCRMTFNIPEGLNYVPSGSYSLGGDETSPYTMAYSQDETYYMYFYWYGYYYQPYSGSVYVVNPQHEQIPQYVYMDYTEGYYWCYHARVTFGKEPAVRSVNINNTEPDANGNYVDVYTDMCYDDNCTQFYEGTAFTITPKLQNGYELLEWTGTNSSDVVKNQDGTYTLVVGNKNYNITPVFASVAEDGVITTLVNDANFGHIEGVVSGTKYDAGTYLNLNAVAENGYMFAEWEDHDTSNPRKIRVSGDATYKAIFKKAYTIQTSVNEEGKGSISISPAQITYYEGQQITLTATPANSLCNFVKWQKNGADIQGGASLNVTVNANDSYVAFFEGIEATEIDIQAAMNKNHGWGWGYCFYYWAKTYGYDIQVIAIDNWEWAAGEHMTINDINTSKSYINDHGTKVTFTDFTGDCYTENGKNVLEALVKGNNGKAYLLKLRGKTADGDDTAQDYNRTYSSFNKDLTHQGNNIWKASSQDGTGADYSTTWCNHFYFKVDPTKTGDIPSGIYQLDDSQATGTLISTSGSNYQSYGSYHVQSYVYYVPASGYAEVINTNGTYYVKFEGYNSRGYNYTVTIGTKPITTHKVTFKVEGQKDVVMDVEEGQTPAYPDGTPTKESTVSTVYTFTGWNPAITAVGSEDQVYTATFSESTRQYEVTITAPTNGTIKVMNGQTEVKTGDKVDYNTVLSVTAKHATGYHFDAWIGDVTSSSVSLGAEVGTITIIGDKTIGATFAIDQFTLTMDACTGGTYSVTYGGETKYTGAAEQTFTIDYNTFVTLSAEPATGYEFKGWRQIVDDSGNVDAAPRRAAMDGETLDGGPEEEETLIEGETLQFNIQANAEYQAVFKKQRFTLTINIEGDGTVEAKKAGIVINPTITVDYNTEITLTALPNTEEHNIFDSWSDGVTTAERVINVTKDSTITVTFKKETFTLTTAVNNAEWGSVEVTPEQDEYEWGTIVTIKAVNTPGYQLDNWNEDNELKDKKYELEITEDMAFTAYFKENFQLVDDKNLGDEYYNTLAALAESGETMNVTYVRTISAGWNVVSLPFNYSYRKGTNTALKGCLRSIDKVVYADGNLTINFLPVTTGIVANTPYVLFSTEEIVNPIFEGVTFEAQEEVSLNKALTAEGVEPVEGSINFLNTAYRQKIGWEEDGSARLPENERKKIIYMNNNSLHFPGATNTVTMRAFRAYFHLNIDDADIQHAPIRFVLEDENEMLELRGEDASTVETKKYFDNEGNLIIERNGVKYDAQGKQL